MKQAAAVAVLVLLAAPAFAECTIQNFTFTQSADSQRVRLSWTPIPNARYTLEEYEPPGFAPLRTRVFTGGSNTIGSVEVNKRTNFNRPFLFRLVAEVTEPGGSISICASNRLQVQYMADPATVKTLNRAAIPIVGSTPGAFGSLWKTYVRLTATADNQTVRLVFHPAGQAGSPSDPEATIAFAKIGDFREWNDVVPELFHRTGLGTIDIYPVSNTGIPSAVPVATTRIYNDGPNGRFGAFVDQVQPSDFTYPLHADTLGFPTLTVAAPGPNFRVNVGVRAFEHSHVSFVLRGPDGVVKETRVRTFLADQVVLTSVEEMVGIPMQPGDTLRIAPAGFGTVVPFYSLTDQSSNDPAYFMPIYPVLTRIPSVELPPL